MNSVLKPRSQVIFIFSYLIVNIKRLFELNGYLYTVPLFKSFHLYSLRMCFVSAL